VAGTIRKDDLLSKGKNMRYRTIFVVFLLLIVIPIETPAQGPPFNRLEIKGKTNERFNRVSLFSSGSDVRPYKTAHVTSGLYSLIIDIPQDMHAKGKYYITDMRFWEDINDNGNVDSGESKSQCHFIIWEIKSSRISMQIYKGPELEIPKSTFEYYYE
jgi:hypothetical protein